MTYYYTIYKWQHIFLYQRRTAALHFNANASTNGDAATIQLVVTTKIRKINQLSEPCLTQLTSVSFILSHNLINGKHWNKIKTAFPHDCTKLLGWTMFAIPDAWLSLGWKKIIALHHHLAQHLKKKQWKTGNSPLLTSSKTPNWQQWKKTAPEKILAQRCLGLLFFRKKNESLYPHNELVKIVDSTCLLS